MGRLLILPVVVVLSFFVFFNSSCFPQETPEQKIAREAHLEAITAYVMAQQFVKRQLRSPATAEFPPLREAIVLNMGDGRFYVSAYVDAANAFGALIRTPFQSVIRREGDNWFAESVELFPQ